MKPTTQTMSIPNRRAVLELLKQVKQVPEPPKDLLRLERRLKFLSAGVATRVLCHLLRYKGRLNRAQMLHYTPKDLIPSKTKLTQLLRFLEERRRVKVFLPTGWIEGKDTRAYKLNPARQKLNFPEAFQNNARARNLRWALTGSTKPVKLPEVVKGRPVGPDTRPPPEEELKKTRDLVYKAAGIPQLQQTYQQLAEYLVKLGVRTPNKTTATTAASEAVTPVGN